MRDIKYFNGKLYCFINEEIKGIIDSFDKKKYPNKHYIIDDALRLLLRKEKIQLPKKPMRPNKAMTSR